MPGKLEELIEKINEEESDKVTCVLADESSGWALDVAVKMKIRRVALLPASAAALALSFNIPKLIHEGIINDEGTPLKSQEIDFTVFYQGQFQELALALELLGRPFLWVVRPDTTDGTCDPNPEGYQERAGSRGLSNGIPFLCWPYFADQLLNESYICDIWKVGLRFDKNESGIITKGEIKNKMEQLLSDENFKVRASKLKEMAMNNIKEGGQSYKIFKNFIKWMKS
ncbi:hypothetical protein PS1_024114 [Malus domestica]